MKIIGIIPSRFGSTRLPGKPMRLIGPMPMIEHVWRRAKACKLLSEVVVATDDERIKTHIESIGGRVVLTPTELPSGTDRCAFALEKLGVNLGLNFEPNDLVVNIQGDEPFVDEGHLACLVALFGNTKTSIGTLACAAKTLAEVNNAARPKVVVSEEGDAMYFSRQVVPYQRDAKNGVGPVESYLLHIGLYAYTVAALQEIVLLKPSRLEMMEQLEQLRWLEAGHKIAVGIVNHASLGVDTEEDLQRANEYYNSQLGAGGKD